MFDSTTGIKLSKHCLLIGHRILENAIAFFDDHFQCPCGEQEIFWSFSNSRLSFYIIIKQAINAKLGRSHLHWDIHVLKHKNWLSKHGSRVGPTEGIVIRKGRNLTYTSLLWFSISLIFLSFSIISPSICEIFSFASRSRRFIFWYLKTAENNE